jgi:NADH:ubiquinone oxidoreductase subunit 2 (subunit N)
MYMRDPAGTDDWGHVGAGSALAMAVSVALVLGLGVYPAPLLELARIAARAIY